MPNILALVGPLLSCYFLLRIFRPAGASECVLVFFSLLTAHVVTLGYMLSFMDRLGDITLWSILGIGAALISAAAVVWNGNSRQSVLPRFRSLYPTHVVGSIKNWYMLELSRFERLLLTPLILTCLLLGLLNLMVIIRTAPGNFDSMGYHLARVAYYLQHGNLSYFYANYWAQVVHPKNSSILLLYACLVSGRTELGCRLLV